jgi:nitrogen regulatory protein P-II 1
MKKIEAIIKTFKLEEIKEALEKRKIQDLTIFEVKGAGRQEGHVSMYRGAEYVDLPSKLRVEVIVEDDEVEQVTDTILNALRTGLMCDGEIAILPMERLVRVCIGERP